MIGLDIIIGIALGLAAGGILGLILYPFKLLEDRRDRRRT